MEPKREYWAKLYLNPQRGSAEGNTEDNAEGITEALIVTPKVKVKVMLRVNQ
jgi:hypothetical protein